MAPWVKEGLTGQVILEGKLEGRHPEISEASRQRERQMQRSWGRRLMYLRSFTEASAADGTICTTMEKQQELRAQ